MEAKIGIKHEKYTESYKYSRISPIIDIGHSDFW